jgi:hypothetical protein
VVFSWNLVIFGGYSCGGGLLISGEIGEPKEMDNPQIMHATYQNGLTAFNSLYCPWKNIPSIAKASNVARTANWPMRIIHSPERDNNITSSASLLRHKLKRIKVALAIITFTLKIIRNFLSGTMASIEKEFLHIPKCHSGPQLWTKYATPTNGAASILDIFPTYRSIDNDNPSTKGSPCKILMYTKVRRIVPSHDAFGYGLGAWEVQAALRDAPHLIRESDRACPPDRNMVNL